MATAIERTQTVIEALLDKPVDSALLLRVANRFMTHWQSEFDALVADPEAPTANEKAGFFLKKMTDFGKDIIRAEGQKEVIATVTDDIETGGDTAAADLE